MPRLARLDAPGVIHHIIIRGIERRKIFRDKRDRENFLERLGDLLLEARTACYGGGGLRRGTPLNNSVEIKEKA